MNDDTAPGVDTCLLLVSLAHLILLLCSFKQSCFFSPSFPHFLLRLNFARECQTSHCVSSHSVSHELKTFKDKH